MPTPEAQITSEEKLQRVFNQSPERIWNSALGSLQFELTRAAYDTWIRDVEPVGFIDNAFVLRVLNQFALEEIKDKYLESIERAVSKSIGYDVPVHVVVDGTEEFKPSSSQKALNSFDRTPIDDHSPSKDNLKDNHHLDIQWRFRNYWTEIVDPNRIISINRYFIKYWLPILGPSFSSMVLAFQQQRFLSKTDKDAPIEIPVSKLLQWIRVDETTFYRYLNESHPLFSWFVQKAPSSKSRYVRTNGGKIRQKAHQYIVFADTPLAPPHLVAVKELLTGFGAGKDAKDTIQALESALNIPDSELTEILESSFDSYLKSGSQSHPSQALTITEIATGFLQDDGDIPFKQIIKLAEKLELRITSPDRSIPITWYFIQEWQPLVKSAAFWFIIYLRSLGFYDIRSNELRNVFWIDGGYSELGTRLDVSSETVSGWLGNNRKQSQTTISDFVGLFVQELERTRGRDPVDKRRLSVKLKIEMLDPLTPDGELLFEQMAVHDGGLYKIQDLVMPSKNYPEKCKSGSGNYPEFNQSGEDDSPEICQPGETNSPENCQSGEGNYPEKRKSLKDSLKTKDHEKTLENQNTFIKTTTHNVNQLILPLIYSQEARSEETSSSGDWDLESLLRKSALPPKQIEKMLSSGIHGREYVAWLLYAFSSEGAGIDQPAFFAVKRLLDNPSVLAQDEWQCLADRGPDFVFRNIRYAIDPLEGVLSPEWENVMGRVGRDRLERLLRALALEHEIEGG